jgi:FkbM family methyltransferase
MAEIEWIPGPLGPFAIPSAPPHTRERVKTICEGVFAGEYESPNLPALKTPYVIDIGSLVGAFAHWAGAKWPGERITCFDPNREAQLIHRAHNLRPGVALQNSAVTSQREAHFQIDGGDWTGGRTHLISSGETVPVVHPGHLIPCDVLKIDAEGVELEILEHYPHFDTLSLLIYEYHFEEYKKRGATLARAAGLECLHESAVPNLGVSIWAPSREVIAARAPQTVEDLSDEELAARFNRRGG